MNVFYREHVRGTLCEQLQLSQRITIPPVTNSYTSQAFSFFFFWELLHENGRRCAKKCLRINLRLFNSRCDKFMTKLLLA